MGHTFIDYVVFTRYSNYNNKNINQTWERTFTVFTLFRPNSFFMSTQSVFSSRPYMDPESLQDSGDGKRRVDEVRGESRRREQSRCRNNLFWVKRWGFDCTTSKSMGFSLVVFRKRTGIKVSNPSFWDWVERRSRWGQISHTVLNQYPSPSQCQCGTGTPERSNGPPSFSPSRRPIRPLFSSLPVYDVFDGSLMILSLLPCNFLHFYTFYKKKYFFRVYNVYIILVLIWVKISIPKYLLCFFNKNTIPPLKNYGKLNYCFETNYTFRGCF